MPVRHRTRHNMTSSSCSGNHVMRKYVCIIIPLRALRSTTITVYAARRLPRPIRSSTDRPDIEERCEHVWAYCLNWKAQRKEEDKLTRLILLPQCNSGYFAHVIGGGTKLPYLQSQRARNDPLGLSVLARPDRAGSRAAADRPSPFSFLDITLPGARVVVTVAALAWRNSSSRSRAAECGIAEVASDG